MAIEVHDLLARFPEFEGAAGSDLIEKVLVEATRRTDATVWGNKFDDGVIYRAAHLLAISPFGKDARLQSKDGSTVYGKELDRLMREVSPGFRVA